MVIGLAMVSLYCYDRMERAEKKVKKLTDQLTKAENQSDFHRRAFDNLARNVEQLYAHMKKSDDVKDVKERLSRITKEPDKNLFDHLQEG